MGWGRFFFEIYIQKGNEDLAFLSMSNGDDVLSHRNKIAVYLAQLDSAIANNDPDDLDIVMNS